MFLVWLSYRLTPETSPDVAKTENKGIMREVICGNEPASTDTVRCGPFGADQQRIWRGAELLSRYPRVVDLVDSGRR